MADMQKTGLLDLEDELTCSVSAAFLLRLSDQLNTVLDFFLLQVSSRDDQADSRRRFVPRFFISL